VAFRRDGRRRTQSSSARSLAVTTGASASRITASTRPEVIGSSTRPSSSRARSCYHGSASPGYASRRGRRGRRGSGVPVSTFPSVTALPARRVVGTMGHVDSFGTESWGVALASRVQPARPPGSQWRLQPAARQAVAGQWRRVQRVSCRCPREMQQGVPCCRSRRGHSPRRGRVPGRRGACRTRARRRCCASRPRRHRGCCQDRYSGIVDPQSPDTTLRKVGSRWRRHTFSYSALRSLIHGRRVPPWNHGRLRPSPLTRSLPPTRGRYSTCCSSISSGKPP
jgi:hypothetical protein